MASRKTPPPPQRVPFHPASENAVYRDLLLFEERLKTNASLLKKRKSRYQLLLVQLFAVILFLASEVFFETHLLDMPCNYALQKALPEEFARGHHTVELHPFIAKGLLLVSITTLLLFFASGLYEEKIAYANRYVPHANRALRNFNMYLNVRHRPLRLRLFVNPLSQLFNRSESSSISHMDIEEAKLQEPQQENKSGSYTRIRSRPPSPDRRQQRKRGTSVPIPPIPPTNNPRGELIFSSRVDRGFRESYERYRAAFERRREARECRRVGWWIWPWNWSWSWIGLGRRSGVGRQSMKEQGMMMTLRGRGSDSERDRDTTPSSSRRSSPAPGSIGRRGTRGGGRAAAKRNESRNRSESPSPSATPPSAVPRHLTPERARTESFSFLLVEDADSFG